MTKRIPQNRDEYARLDMRLLANASEEQQRRVFHNATVGRLLNLDVTFENWAHRNQLEPSSEGWRTWLMMAGRGFGKTRAGAEWIYRIGNARPRTKIALVGATIADARAVMVEGVSGVLAVADMRKKRLKWEPGLGRLTWPNGTTAQLFSGDSADGLRGPEHDFAWCDELAKWRQAEETWHNLEMGLRRGSRPRALVTTTPRPMPLLEMIRDGAHTITTSGRTSDNLNLDQKFIDIIKATYDGTRLGRQELDGELITDVEGALWTHEVIERARRPEVALAGANEVFDRIAVGVDPPASIGDRADACGIVVAGSKDNELFVLEDASVQGLSPEGWSNRVAAAAARWGTTLVVAEANNGGAMVESVLNAADTGLNVRLVHASRGKCARAEPIALKFEAGKAFFAGIFPELEGELGAMIAGGGFNRAGKSPDRADAMVWAMTVLSETRSGLPRVRFLQ